MATSSIYHVLSITFYNVAFICTFPSWTNGKNESVSPKKVLKYVCIGTLICFILIGYLGGIAFSPYYTTSADLLSKLNDFMPNHHIQDAKVINFFKYFGAIFCYFYPILQNLTGIPVFAAVIRCNLINTNILKSRRSANILSIWIPFVFSIVLYHGNGFNVMLNWSGVLLSSFINFVLPIFFYYKALLRTQSEWTQVASSEHHRLMLEKRNLNLNKLTKNTNIILWNHQKNEEMLLNQAEEYRVYHSINSVASFDLFGLDKMKRAEIAFFFLCFTILLAVIAAVLDVIGAFE